MIPYIIAGAVGFGIAKLLEKDNTKKYAEGGEAGKKYILLGYSATASRDTYEDGELESVGDWDEKISKEFSNKKDLIDYINEKIIYVDYQESDFDWESGEGKNIQTDVLCSYDDYNGYFPASEEEKKDWKKGKWSLFNVHYFINVQAVIPTTYKKGGGVDKMDKFISELAKKNTKEFSVNEYHDFRNKKYAIGVARHYFRDNDGSFSKFDTKLGDALNIDFETQGDSNKYAGGGKTGEIKDGDSVIMYFNQDTELEIFESEDLEEEPYIDVFKKGEKFEVDIFGVDDTIYDVQFGDGDVAFIRKNNVTIVSVNDKTFAEGGEAGEYSEEVEKILENLEPEGVKFEGNSREGFSVLVKDKNSDFSAFVDVYMQGSDVNWEWNQYMFARNNSMDMLQSELQDNIDIADYFSSEAIHYLEQQGAIQQDDNGDWSYTKKYESGGSVSKGYMVFNYTDNLYATYDVFKTKKLANDFIKEFRNRYSKQGYYRDNRMNKIYIKDIDLLAIPSDFNPLK